MVKLGDRPRCAASPDSPPPRPVRRGERRDSESPSQLSPKMCELSCWLWLFECNPPLRSRVDEEADAGNPRPPWCGAAMCTSDGEGSAKEMVGECDCASEGAMPGLGDMNDG